MQIVADTHVHVYPFYDLGRQLAAARHYLAEAATGADAKLLCLAERAGQREFQAIRDGTRAAPNWSVATTGEPDSLHLRGPDGDLLLLAGRQIVTAERVEVLALGRDLDVPDGLPLREALARTRGGGAVPVLPWGLGKWWGRRGVLLKNILDTSGPDDVVCADTCLRPALFHEPALLRLARSRGFSILYGTDPLPRPNEEDITGRFATLWEADWDPAHPAAAWRRIIRARTPGRPVGRRCGVGEAVKRIR